MPGLAASWRGATPDEIDELERQIERPLPPFYRWPRGYRVGTHAWAARQWCETEAQGWAEVHTIDPEIVKLAAGHGFVGAQRHLADQALP